MTSHAPRFRRPSPCATRPYLTPRSSSLHLTPIHRNATLPAPCDSVHLTRQLKCRWSVRTAEPIKYESGDESNCLLTPSRASCHPMGPKRGLKRRLQAIETPPKKRVKVVPPATNHGATSTANGLAAFPTLAQFYPDVQHCTLLSKQPSHFMLWIAHMVLIYVVRVRAEDWPRPSLPPAVVHAFANDVQVVMSGYNLPDRQGIREDLVVLSLWYLQRLSPKGFVDVDDLSTEDGLLAARRLLLLVFSFVSKWLVDYSSVCLERFVPYYGKGFSRSAAITLEISALEAFEHSLYIPAAQFSNFRSSLAEWSSRVDTFSPFYDTHTWMAKCLRVLPSDNLATGKNMRMLHRSRPSAFSIYKVHATLLIGLDNLLTKFPPFLLEFASPSAAEPIGDPQIRQCCDPQVHNPCLSLFPECSLCDFTCEGTSSCHKRSSCLCLSKTLSFR